MSNGIDRTNAERAIGLSHDDPRDVHVRAADGDQFFLQAAHAVAGCQLGSELQFHMEQAQEKSSQLNNRVRDWCGEHQEVSRAVAGFRSLSDGSVIVILLADGQDEFSFDDQASELDIELRRDYPEFNFSVVSLPTTRAENISAYIEPDKAFVLYATNSETTQSTG